MPTRSIGQFIAALRKANGLTQQDVADRLNVSNKAVSRWERDECAPDITLIPALAEMFGVTCDELLRGERILDQAPVEKKDTRTEKQLKTLLNRTASGFKNLIYIAMAIAAVGLICMFGISYGFYRPVIGGFVMILFEAAAIALTLLAVNKVRDVENGYELFESASDEQKLEFDRLVGKLSFCSWFASFAAVVLSLPLLIFTTDYANSVLTAESYLIFGLPAALAVLCLIYKLSKPYFIARFTGETVKINKEKLVFSCIQNGMTLAAGILCFVSTYFYDDIPASIFAGIGLALLAANIIFSIIKLKKHREFLLTGLRNLFFIPATIIVYYAHSMGYWTAGEHLGISFDIWSEEYFLYATIYIAAVYLIFTVIEKSKKKGE